MSLLHWWPLNGNTKDLGLNPVSLTNNNATINNNGKIGQTYRYNGGVMVANNNDLSSSTTNLTIAGWVYLNSGNYAYVFSCRQGTGGPGLFISLEIGCSIFDDGTRWTTNYSIPLNTWVHFAFTRDSSSKKLYINGVLHSQTSTLGNLSQIHNKMYIGRNYYNDTASTSSDVMINDLRIYNHALSAKEVKELSKGLILHYNFEDCYNNNLLINSDQYTFTNKLTVSRAWADGWSCWPIYFNSLTTATTYTLSVDFDGLLASTHGAGAPKDPTQRYCTVWLYFRNTAFSDTDYSSYNTPICFTANNYNHKQISATRHQWTFTLGTNITYYPCCAIRTNTYSDGSTTVTVNFWNFKLEKSNTSTPFISNTLSQQQVYDNSGYGYNGTVNGDLQVTSDSASGQQCVKFVGKAADRIFNTVVPQYTKNITFNVWCYQESASSPQAGQYIISQGRDFPNNGNGFNILSSFGTACLRGDFGLISSGVNIVSGWHMITGTYDGANVKLYVDGEIKNTLAYTGDLTYEYAPAFVIGKMAYGYTGSTAYFMFNGRVADVKVYSTALSAEDILAEYNRKAAIDRNGNLFTGEFVEENTNASIADKNNQIKAAYFVEGTNKVKIYGGYTELQYLDQINPAASASSEHNRCVINDISYDYIEARLNVNGSGSSGSIMLSNGNWWKSSQGRGGVNSGGGTVTMTPSTVTQNVWTDVNWDFSKTFNGLWTSGWCDKYNYWTPQNLKIAYIKAYVGSNLTGHFIPVINKNNVIGLLNLINNKFYSNTGSGNFVAGNSLGILSVIQESQLEEL